MIFEANCHLLDHDKLQSNTIYEAESKTTRCLKIKNLIQIRALQSVDKTKNKFKYWQLIK